MFIYKKAWKHNSFIFRPPLFYGFVIYIISRITKSGKLLGKHDMKIDEILKEIKPPDEAAMDLCRKKWNSIAKPLHGMGRLEEAIIQCAGIINTAKVIFDRKLLITMCADNGVVCEGVSQSGQDVTRIVSDNFFRGETTACIMSRYAGADVWPVDIGVADDTLIENRKIARGSANMAKGPAMSRNDAQNAILVGIDKMRQAKEAGYNIVATGEMGIGNTTTSAAVASVLLDMPPQEAAGRGAGMDSATFANKIDVIKRSIEVNNPDKNDVIDVLSKVGGFDICGMCGLFIGGAVYRLPVVIDGLISSVAALCAVRIDKRVKDFILPSHESKEPAAGAVLKAIGLEPYLKLGMHLGEGTGAVALFPILDLALEIYYKMVSFTDINIDQYEEYEN